MWRRAVRWIPAALGLGVELLTSGGGSIERPPVYDPTFEPGTDSMVGMVSVDGTGAGLPVRYPGSQLVSVYRDRATIQPGLTEIELPLQGLAVVRSQRVGLRWTRPKAVDAMWVVQVRGDGIDLTFRGSWLLLAQLGTLGRWPEPA